MNRPTLVVSFSVLLALGAFLRPGLSEVRQEQRDPRLRDDVVLSLLNNLGEEVRWVLARQLWQKVDAYVHEGPLRVLPSGERAVTMVGYEEIVPLYTAVLALDPSFIEAYSLAGEHLTNGLGRPREGRAILQKGIALNPENPLTSELHGQMAALLLRDDGDEEEALLHLQKAWRLRQGQDDRELPMNFIFDKANLASMLGVCFYRMDRRDEARHWLSKPNRLPAGHPILDALGIEGVPVPDTPGSAHEHEHAHEHGHGPGHSDDHAHEQGRDHEGGHEPRAPRSPQAPGDGPGGAGEGGSKEPTESGRAPGGAGGLQSARGETLLEGVPRVDPWNDTRIRRNLRRQPIGAALFCLAVAGMRRSWRTR